MLAALYVAKNGPYFGLPEIDPWDEARDARTYAGPWRVIAHPPCERWGRYARGGPNPRARRWEIGDDGGCFAAALASVRTWGGVLEHPEASHAFSRFGLGRPPRAGGWTRSADDLGWICCVEQGHYGHVGRKATWLYLVTEAAPAPLIWGPCAPKLRLDPGYRSAEHARRARATRERIPLMSRAQRLHTPPAFRDTLIALAR